MYEHSSALITRMQQLAEHKQLANIRSEKFAMVTMPKGINDVIEDILQEKTDLRSLILQVLGGLEPRSIVLITKDRHHAHKVADLLMTGIEDAEQELVTQEVADAHSVKTFKKKKSKFL